MSYCTMLLSNFEHAVPYHTSDKDIVNVTRAHELGDGFCCWLDHMRGDMNLPQPQDDEHFIVSFWPNNPYNARRARQRGLRRWDKNTPEALAVRNRFRSDKSDKSEQSDVSDPYGVASTTAEAAANTLICLINQATYLLKRQLEKLEQNFLQEGGFTERLYQVRQEMRRNGGLRG